MNNDDITKVKTAKYCAQQQWNSLFMARDYRRSLFNNNNNASSSFTNDAVKKSHNNDANNIHTSSTPQDDVFDCSDLIIPPSHELVNREVERGIQRWKDLASRVIIEEDDHEPTMIMGCGSLKTAQDGDDDGCDNNDNYVKKNDVAVVPLRHSNHELLLDAATSGDKRKHRLLPYNFDYTCKTKKKKTSSSDESSDNNSSGEKNEDGGSATSSSGRG